MSRGYQVVDRGDSRKLAELLSKEGQLLLPMLDLITEAELAVDELIDVAGWVATLSACTRRHGPGRRVVYFVRLWAASLCSAQRRGRFPLRHWMM